MAVIELPESPAPNGVSVDLLDYGITIRPSTGAGVTRVNRKGSRFRLTVSLPPMKPEVAEIFVARLLAAKSQGVRIPFPLLRSQGSPGSPVVDGAGQSGTSLVVCGFTPGYAAKEGYKLSIEDASGQHYLHSLAAAVRADALGDATLTITPELRVPFADGDAIHLAKPMVEGFVDGDAWGWQIPVNRLIALEFILEEAA